MATFVDGMKDMGTGLVLGEVAECCKPVVVGVDFGTAYSGIAFAYKADPGAIQCGAPTATDATQMKVPTVLLQHDDGSWDFGYTAEKKYNDILMDHVHGAPLPAHLFKRFKMVLKDEDEGFDTLMCTSLDGMPHLLLDLIVRALGFLKDFALEKVAFGFGGEIDPLHDVQWVLTVPAIWNDFGKAFMRKAAFQAGMIPDEQSDNLLLVLEPEGASLAVHVGAAQFGLLGQGSRFMVLDCGGGTVDITVHEVQSVLPLKMKAIAVPTGGDWGGDCVNLEFKKFLKELIGDALFKEHELPLELYNVYGDFDKLKVMFDPAGDPGHLRLIDLLENKRQLVELAAAWNAKHSGTPIVISPTLRNGFLTMSKELMLSFFEPFLKATVDETRRVLRDTPGIRHIMVVGGFGSSKVLTSRIKAEFHNRGGVKVLLPDARPKPQGAIVHGAVYYGLHRDIISSRVAAYTYGVAVRRNGESDCFSVLVTKGEELPSGHEVEKVGVPSDNSQGALTWCVYRSAQLAPTKVTGEHRLGRLVVNCPPDPVRANRQQRARFCFGGSEISVVIVNAKGVSVKGEISMT